MRLGRAGTRFGLIGQRGGGVPQHLIRAFGTQKAVEQRRFGLSGSRTRGQLAHGEGPNFPHADTPREGLADAFEQEDLTRSEEQAEIDGPAVVGVFDFVEEDGLFLSLVEDGRAECRRPGRRRRRANGLPVFRGVQVDITEIRVARVGNRRLSRLAGAGQQDQSPFAGCGHKTAQMARNL